MTTPTLTIFAATKLAEIDSVREVLRTGVDVNSQNEDGWTALHFAAEKGLDEIMTVLLNEYNADPFINSKKQWTPLHVAATAGSLSSLHILVPIYRNAMKEGNTSVSLDLLNSYKLTPLMCALQKNNLECAKYLINQGSDFSLKDSDGVSSFIMCCRDGYYSVFETILKEISLKHAMEMDTDKPSSIAITRDDFTPNVLKEIDQLLNSRCNNGYSPLHYSVIQNQDVLVSRLLNLGANPFERDFNGYCSYELGAIKRKEDALWVLLRFLDVSETDYITNTSSQRGMDVIPPTKAAGALSFDNLWLDDEDEEKDLPSSIGFTMEKPGSFSSLEAFGKLFDESPEEDQEEEGEGDEEEHEQEATAAASVKEDAHVKTSTNAEVEDCELSSESTQSCQMSFSDKEEAAQSCQMSFSDKVSDKDSAPVGPKSSSLGRYYHSMSFTPLKPTDGPDAFFGKFVSTAVPTTRETVTTSQSRVRRTAGQTTKPFSLADSPVQRTLNILLLICAKAGHAALAKDLMRIGADPLVTYLEASHGNAVEKSTEQLELFSFQPHHTAFHYACEGGHVDVLLQLLRYSVLQQKIPTAKIFSYLTLLSNKASAVDPSAKHYASCALWGGHASIIRALFYYDFNLNTCVNHKLSMKLIFEAVLSKENQEEMVETLMELGAKPNEFVLVEDTTVEGVKSPRNDENDENDPSTLKAVPLTPLMQACRLNLDSIVQLFLQYQSVVLRMEDQNGYTAASHAVSTESIDALKALLEGESETRFADISINACSSHGLSQIKSPLGLSVYLQSLPCLEILLDAKVDHFRTVHRALLMAIVNQDEKAVQLLASRQSVMIELPYRFPKDPFDEAIESIKRQDLAESVKTTQIDALELDHEKVIEAEGGPLTQPMHVPLLLATYVGYLPVVKELIHWIDSFNSKILTMEGGNRPSPMDIAQNLQHRDVIQYFEKLQHGL